MTESQFNEDWLASYQERAKGWRDQRQNQNPDSKSGAQSICHQERQNRTDEIPDAENGQPEAKLQAKVEKELRRRGWYFFHDRSRGENEPGFLDLVIAAPGGITLWLELKRKGGKLTPKQQQTKARLLYLGHRVFEVRSFRQALRILDGAK